MNHRIAVVLVSTLMLSAVAGFGTASAQTIALHSRTGQKTRTPRTGPPIVIDEQVGASIVFSVPPAPKGFVLSQFEWLGAHGHPLINTWAQAVRHGETGGAGPYFEVSPDGQTLSFLNTAGQSGRIRAIYTNHAGQSWQATSARVNPSSGRGPSAITAADLVQMTFFTAHTGVLAGYRHGTFDLWTTTDGGIRWTRDRVPGVPASTPPAVGFQSARVGWVAWVTPAPRGNTLTVLRTMDGGAQWTRISQRVPSVVDYVGQITFASPRDGWIHTFSGGSMGGSIPSIFHTTNGGHSWTLVSSGGSTVANPAATPLALPASDEFMPMTFPGPRTGWAAVGEGIPHGAGPASLYQTTTAGHTWDPVPLPVPHALRQGYATLGYPPIFRHHTGTVVVQYDGSSSNTLVGYHSTNGGQTWSAGATLSLNPAATTLVTSFVNPDTGWVIGSAGSVWAQTQNGGQTWQTSQCRRPSRRGSPTAIPWTN